MCLLSVLILTKNEENNVDHSVGAVFSQEITVPIEVVVVDSGSTDGTLKKLQRYPVKLFQIRPDEFHHSRTRNFIAEQAAGEILVYLAGDAWPASRNWLSSLVQCFDDKSVGAAYGRHLPKPGCSLERSIALKQVYGESRLYKNRANRLGQGFQFYHFSTVNCAMRREIWSELRFPEDQRVFEDLAISKRILDAGWSIVYDPLAAVYHSHDYPAMKLFRRYFDGGVIWKQLGILDDEALRSMKSGAIAALWRKVAFMRAKGCGVAEVARAVTRDIAKASGFALGQHENYLPVSVKQRFSDFDLFT